MAAALQCRTPNRLAWVGVYPLNLSDAPIREFLANEGLRNVPEKGCAYHIRTFEIDRSLVDANSSVGEGDLTNKKSLFAFDDNELAQQLLEFGISIEALEPHYKTDYPI